MKAFFFAFVRQRRSPAVQAMYRRSNGILGTDHAAARAGRAGRWRQLRRSARRRRSLLRSREGPRADNAFRYRTTIRAATIRATTAIPTPRHHGRRSSPDPEGPVYGNDSYANDRYGSSRYGSDPYARSAYGGERYSPDPDPRNAYGNEPNSGSGYGRDDYGAWDAAPSAEDEDASAKHKEGLAARKPYIAPVAPPKVAFSGPYAPGSIVIDTSARKLYYVLSTTTAYAYSIGVGRQGFTWTGKEKVSRELPIGRTGIRRPKCASESLACRSACSAVSAIRSAQRRSISAIRFTASTVQ